MDDPIPRTLMISIKSQRTLSRQVGQLRNMLHYTHRGSGYTQLE